MWDMATVRQATWSAGPDPGAPTVSVAVATHLRGRGTPARGWPSPMSTTSNSPTSSNGSPAPSPNGASPPAAPAPYRYTTRFKITAVVILAVVAVLGVVAYGIASDSSGDPVASSGGTREFVEQLIPPGGSQVLQQGTVGIDLVSGWTGELSIDGVAIPASDLDTGQEGPGDTVSSGLERLTFTPGPSKVMEDLPLGPVCAQAVVWDRAAGRDNSQRTVSWCFEVI